MLKNLTYFDTDGRMQLLEVFLVIIEKFPSALLDTYAELFFFTLFLRLVNDPAEKCRIKVADVLKKLISKASQQRALLETVFKIGKQHLLSSYLHIIKIEIKEGKSCNFTRKAGIIIAMQEYPDARFGVVPWLRFQFCFL